MGTTANDAEIIILSDDEDEASENDACTESSVYIVEPENTSEPGIVLTPCPLEEDLVVTFSRPAQVLPHARHDCPIHPFTATDCALEAPLAENQLICDQCFCYICDKLASSCVLWCRSGSCHCNSHKKSPYWSRLRDCLLLGGLHSFNLTLSEIDTHLRHAEEMLQIFKKDMSVVYSTFMRGKLPAEYGLNTQNQQQVLHDYTPVYGLVSSFLDKADQQEDRAAAILRLGAAEEFIRHVNVPRSCILQSPMADANKAKEQLLQRVILSLQRQLVMADFKPEFRHKLQDFYRRYLFPSELKHLRNSLGVRPWDDILLVTVLKGQNVSGFRKEGKKKDVLAEDISIVFLRSELLQRQKRYRELCRYLRVVQSAEYAFRLQHLRDLIPFFLCLEGDFTSAVDSLLRPGNGPVSRFTPQLFLNYLCIFRSATAPKVTIGHPSHLWHSNEAWEPIQGAVPLKREMLVKFGLKVHGCCMSVYASISLFFGTVSHISVLQSQCWTSFLTLVNTPGLPAPPANFLLEARAVVNSILLDQNIQIPRFFLEEYPDQALLLLVTGALGLRILRCPPKPMLPVLSTFKDNLWALEWLRMYLSFDLPFGRKNLGFFIPDIREEIRWTKGDGHFLEFLNSL